MTSTAPGIEAALRESGTALGEWDDLMQDWQGHRSSPIILLAHHVVDTNLSASMAGPIYAGQMMPTALYYVASCMGPVAEGSTGLINIGPQTEETIRGNLDWLIAQSVYEVFFDGMESRLSYGLKQLLRVGGNASIRVIRSLMESGELNAEQVGEILRVLGDFDDPATHRSRLSVLLDCLRSPDSRVRDAASIRHSVRGRPVGPEGGRSSGGKGADSPVARRPATGS